jgi:phosphatidylserine decarboxylase
MMKATETGSMSHARHQYVERYTGRICTERLHGDRCVRALYRSALETPSRLLSIASSSRFSSALSFLNYDAFISARAAGMMGFIRDSGIDLSECVESPKNLDTPRRLFERKIRYWERRPLPRDPRAAACPADARVLVGSLIEASRLFIKGKFFEYDELLGFDRRDWLEAFDGGDFAIFRLTPEKYHYVHSPVAGRVSDFYEIEGRFHSCNPTAVISLVTPHSKNRRSITIIDTDVPGGTRVGNVAVVEIAALMVGRIVQCYSEERYETPRGMAKGMFLKRGQPKSLFQPGGSTVAVLFQRDRVDFASDLLSNMYLSAVESRFSKGFGRPLVETDVLVRSLLCVAREEVS